MKKLFILLLFTGSFTNAQRYAGIMFEKGSPLVLNTKNPNAAPVVAPVDSLAQDNMALTLKGNTAASHIWPKLKGDSLIFTSNIKGKGVGAYFDNYYTKKLGANTTLATKNRIKGELRTKFNDAVSAYTKDGKTVYFTQTGVKKVFDEEGMHQSVVLKLYKASKKRKKWRKQRELPFNGDGYSIGHPVLSPNEDKLYFVSDMPGGMGETDIYSVAILGEDTYGEPVNLGPRINTAKKETSPFVNNDGIFYFSSNGHQGNSGTGMNVFSIAIEDLDQETPKNLGAPINSGQNDVGLVFDEQGNAYFASDRKGGKGGFDIYYVDNTTFLEEQLRIERQLLEEELRRLKEDSQALAESKLIKNRIEQLKKRIAVINDKLAGGDFMQEEKLLLREKQLLEEELVALETYLAALAETQSENDKIARLGIRIGNINDKIDQVGHVYFAFDVWEVDDKGKAALDKIVTAIDDVLKEGENVKITVDSYADSRGSSAYNLKLSAKRTKSVIDYLMGKGIAKESIQGAANGELKLGNKCKGSAKCQEQEHAKNRRAELGVKQF